ncbi:MAG: hypothetical protein ACE5GT_06705, partial [Rhodospirillales bacterium]
MPSNAERRKADLITKAVTASQKRLGGKNQAQFRRFLKAYYENVPPQDIIHESPQTLFALAHGHWKLGQTRPGRKAVVRAFNPDPKKDGWHSD